MPDAQLALRLDRKESAVAVQRRKLGIPCRFEHRPWAEHELDLLGVQPDEEVARPTGHPLGAVEFKRQQLGRPKPAQVMDYWGPEEDKLLGTMTDADLARLLQRTVSGVMHRRIRLEIPMWRRG